MPSSFTIRDLTDPESEAWDAVDGYIDNATRGFDEVPDLPIPVITYNRIHARGLADGLGEAKAHREACLAISIVTELCLEALVSKGGRL